MNDYDSNVIWSVPINSRNSVDLVIGLKSCYKILAEAIITSIIHRLDNEILDELILVIKKKGLKHQVATVHNHCHNPVERAIRTVKNHLTSCLHGLDKFFSAHLWCRTID